MGGDETAVLEEADLVGEDVDIEDAGASYPGRCRDCGEDPQGAAVSGERPRKAVNVRTCRI